MFSRNGSIRYGGGHRYCRRGAQLRSVVKAEGMPLKMVVGFDAESVCVSI